MIIHLAYLSLNNSFFTFVYKGMYFPYLYNILTEFNVLNKKNCEFKIKIKERSRIFQIILIVIVNF